MSIDLNAITDDDQINKVELAPKVKNASKLRLMDKAYSETRELYDGFVKRLSDPAQAEQTLMSIYKKGNPDEIIGSKSDAVRAIRDLEKRTGEKYLDPLRREIAGKEFRNIKAKGGNILNLFGGPGAFIENAGTEGVANFLNFVNGTSSVMNRIQQIALSRGSQALATGATAALNENK